MYHSARPNNFNLIILWDWNYNSFKFKNLHNLAKDKFLKLPEDDREVSNHVGVSII